MEWNGVEWNGVNGVDWIGLIDIHSTLLQLYSNSVLASRITDGRTLLK